MKSVTVSRLRKEWKQVIHENRGKKISITKRGEIVARLRIPLTKRKTSTS
jgi:antitoxin (DNA-binding transcriptional repressor) of toxin-antitoxin stability system